MLVLSRTPSQKIIIGDDIIINYLGIDSFGCVKLGIDAPNHIPIHRHDMKKTLAEKREISRK